MDFVYENSVMVIESLQKRFEHQSDFFFLISKLFDPRYAFLFFFPLLFSINRDLGKKALWVTIIAEWSNQILKWVLHGERPYWWVHETPFYNKTGNNIPDIQQYFMTCETGPGSPSGHVMVTAALWYIIFSSCLEKTGALKINSKNLLSSVIWSFYALMLITVSVSRVYIAAHFPHQCLLGMVIGGVVAVWTNSLSDVHLTRRHYILATAIMLSSALSTYAIIKAMGLNPMWSVDRAVKWCAKQEYIHMDTTPFFSMMRYCGFALGMGLGLGSSFYKKVSVIKFTTSMKILSAILAVTACRYSESVSLPKSNITLFYVYSFLFNAFIPYVVIAIVPTIVASVISKPTRSKQH